MAPVSVWHPDGAVGPGGTASEFGEDYWDDVSAMPNFQTTLL